MSYTALYQKYRSKTFDEVVGQEYVVRAIRNAVKQKKVGHAYLFCGPRGTGKTTMARLLARAVNCEDPEHAPCGKCKNCLASEQEDVHPDIIEINAANETGIEDIRSLIDRVKLAPMLGRYKVYIIDEVHQLSSSAGSALLKILEEPPEHVIFILATTDPQKLLPTIISRCQRFDFTRVETKLIAKHLQKIAGLEKMELSAAAADKIAVLADGGMRDALSILDQCAAYTGGTIKEEDIDKIYGLTSVEEKLNLLKDLSAGDAVSLLNRIRRYEETGIDLKRYTDELIDLLKEGVIWNYSHRMESIQKLNAAQAASVAALCQPGAMMEMIKRLMEAEERYRYASSLTSYFEVACLDLMALLNRGAIVQPAQAKAPVAEEKTSAVPQPDMHADTPAPAEEAEQMPAEPASEPEPPIADQPAEASRPMAEVLPLPQSELISLLVQCSKKEKSADLKKWPQLNQLLPSIHAGRYLSVLKQTQIAASGSDCILLCCREQAVANTVNETEFNQGLYEFLKEQLAIDKMPYAAAEEEFKAASEEYRRLMKANQLPPAMPIHRYQEKAAPAVNETEQIENSVFNLFGKENVEVIAEEEKPNGSSETDGTGAADAEAHRPD